MLTLRKNVVALYVDRSSQQWIVLDAEGNFWIVPSVGVLISFTIFVLLFRERRPTAQPRDLSRPEAA